MRPFSSRRFPGLIAAAVLLSAALVLYLAVLPGRRVPSFASVRHSWQASEARLLDRHGTVIHEMRLDKDGRRLDWTSIGDISPALKRAVVQSEDRRFYDHGGVDWFALSHAVFTNPFKKNIRGASTITMQLASMLDEALRPGKHRRTVWQKLSQIRTALEMERLWSKDEILEAYMNLAAFRGELQGVASASRLLFGKEPHGLNGMESLILCAMLRSPNAPLDKVAERARLLGKETGLLTGQEEASGALATNLSSPRFHRPVPSLVPHAAEQLLKTHGGELKGGVREVLSTLDSGIQALAAEALAEHLSRLKDQNVHDGAVLVVENGAGNVLAYIGSSAALSQARFVDGVRARRQAGSTLKPFLYGAAFDRRLITVASIIDDSPLNIPVFGGLYVPRNYDSAFRGLVTARTALASSLNVPAVKTLGLLGEETFLKTLKDLGIEGLEEEEDFYGPSLALGTADVSLWELTNAYRALANGGLWSPMRLVLGDYEEGPRRVLSKEASFIVSDILSDREARSHTFGLESPLSTRFWTAVKTGTSKDMRDNWCVGFSERYTVGVWVGNFSGEPMWNVSGISGAAHVWVEIMNSLSRNGAVRRQRHPPPGVIVKNVTLPGGDSMTELFMKGTEPLNHAGQRAESVVSRIRYPVNGAMIAIDPDIPEGYQKVFFEYSAGEDALRWVLNGKSLGTGQSLGWSPEAGIYELSLVDEEDMVLDTVSFEVRGGARRGGEGRSNSSFPMSLPNAQLIFER